MRVHEITVTGSTMKVGGIRMPNLSFHSQTTEEIRALHSSPRQYRRLIRTHSSIRRINRTNRMVFYPATATKPTEEGEREHLSPYFCSHLLSVVNCGLSTKSCVVRLQDGPMWSSSLEQRSDQPTLQFLKYGSHIMETVCHQ